MNTKKYKTELSQKEFIPMMALLMSLVALTIDSLIPALGVMTTSLGLQNANNIQYVISIIFIGTATGQIIAGPLSDSVGRRKVLFIGLFVFMLGTIVCLLAKNLQIMLLGRLIQGIGLAGPNISASSIVRDKYKGPKMAKILSLVMMIFIMVPVIAPAIGQTIMLVISWEYILVFYLIYAGGISIWTYLRLEETLPKEKRIKYNPQNISISFKRILSSSTSMALIICMGLIFGSLVSYLSLTQQIFQNTFNLGKMMVVYFAMQAFAVGVSAFINSKIVERLGMRILCRTSMATIFVCSLLFTGLYFYIEIEFSYFFVYGLIIFFCWGMLFGNLNSLVMEPMGDIAGTAAALINFLTYVIGVSIGTLIGQSYNGTVLPLVLGFMTTSFIGVLAINFENFAHKKKLSPQTLKT